MVTSDEALRQLCQPPCICNLFRKKRGIVMDRHRSESNVSASRNHIRIARAEVLTDAEELVLAEIARLMDGSRGEITLAEDLLKVMTGRSGPDVRRAVWSLVSKRYISRRGSFCPDRGTMAAYELCPKVGDAPHQAAA
jgi:hypothetical protein